eukprot:c25631_g1_i1.p1 GENE.c25631_g1_i1~~c25631_g1_i1.p1  ORF type:complete len:1297 (+),score=301.51 c25631_g1_i1:36-3926(+)
MAGRPNGLLSAILTFALLAQASGRLPDVFVDRTFKCPTTIANNTEAVEDTEIIPDASYYSDGFVFVYCWLSLVGGISLLWCFFNQRLFPRGAPESMNSGDPVEDVLTKENERGFSSLALMTQTGYKTNYFAFLLYVLVIVTMIGFQVLLGILCSMYYLVEFEEGPANLRIFQNSSQALYVYQITWHIGFSWCLLLKGISPNIVAAFRRRCLLSEADYVYVFQERRDLLFSTNSGIRRLQSFNRALRHSFLRIISWIFSDTAYTYGVDGVRTCCKVCTNSHGVKYIIYNFRKYSFSSESGLYEPVNFSVGTAISDLIKQRDGLTAQEADRRRQIVGPNIMDIPAPTVFGVVLAEFSKPFYLYQNFMAWSWFNFDYWHMGIVNSLVYISGGLSVCVVNYRNQSLLHSLAKVDGTCFVLRDGREEEVNQVDLVPGDVVVLKTSGPVFCDLALLQGDVLVDESSLTGESMPVAKAPLISLDEAYSAKKHKKATVFAGTTILQTSSSHGEKTLGLVMSTGAAADKGKFLRSILTTPEPLFKFDVQVKLVVVILMCFAVFGFIITIEFLNKDRISGWFYGMYVVGTALPPLLPTVFVVSVGIVSYRLTKLGVICSNPSRILCAGKVRVACFDKTGTLTRQGLDFHGAQVVGANGMFEDVTSSITSSSGQTFRRENTITATPDGPPRDDATTNLIKGMASCHSLSKAFLKTAGGASQATFIGNAVDVKMFEAVGWELNTGTGGAGIDTVTKGGVSLQLARRFDFDHHRQTMCSFVEEKATGSHLVFVKGSAEAVKTTCTSGLPADYEAKVDELSRSGCYVLAIAFRQTSDEETNLLKSSTPVSRDDIEKDMTFLGLITFRNELKPDTVMALTELREGDVRIVMITGDHPLTAVFIARQCGLIRSDQKMFFGKDVTESGDIVWLVDGDASNRADLPEDMNNVVLVVTGAVLHLLQHNESPLLDYVRVYARTSPQDKIDVVNYYVNRGLTTLMCGDGGNDCGALRAAHVGVALSDAEASVVSPFSGLSRSCMDVVNVLRLGRCALASSLASYRYMIMYGQVETFNQIINAYFSITFYEWCWVFMDGLWVVTLAFTLPYAHAAKKLADMRPPSSLLGAYTLSSVLGTLAIHFSFVCLAFGVLWNEDWFKCRHWIPIAIDDITKIGDNYESTVLFLVSGSQYISSAMAFNFGLKYRSPWLYNWRLWILVIAYFVIIFHWTLVESKMSCLVRVNCEAKNVVRRATANELQPINNVFNTTVMPHSFRKKIIAIIVGNTVAVMAYERLVVNGWPGAWLRRRFPQTTPLAL